MMLAKGRRGSSWILVSIASILVMTASTARAEDSSPKPPRYAAWAAKIPDMLHLTESQKAAFERWLSTAAPIPATAAEPSAQDFRAMTTPQRTDYVVNHLESDLTLMRAQAKAMRDFYALLSPAQRKLFDDATSPPTSEHSAPSNDATLDEPPPPPTYQLPSHTDADWMVRPTPDDVSRVFPTAALAAKISGKVSMKCVADESGYLTECVVEDETPAGYGFGNAALEISAYMRMKPATDLGVPVRSTVNVPVNFTFAE